MVKYSKVFIYCRTILLLAIFREVNWKFPIIYLSILFMFWIIKGSSCFSRAPNNPPARGNGAPCTGILYDVAPCGDEDCTQCTIDGVNYPVLTIIEPLSVPCERYW